MKGLLKAIQDVRREELPKALLMCAYFFLVITIFWVLKPVKKGVFISFYTAGGFNLFGWHMVASQAEQLAKVLNMVVAAIAVTVFTLLSRRFTRQKLVFIWSTFFIVFFILYSVLVTRPNDQVVWTFYLFGDLFSTVMVVLFWAFLNDIVRADEAKRLYGIVGLGGVLGGWFGSGIVAALLVKKSGQTPLLLACVGGAALIMLIAYLVGRITEKQEVSAPVAQESHFWKLFFSFEGRINRAKYWIYILTLDLIFCAIILIAGLRVGYIVGSLLIVWPGLVLNVKRCHDRGRSGAFFLISLIPLLNIWYLIEVLFLPGTEGGNKYGPQAELPKKSNAAIEGAKLVFTSKYLLAIAVIIGVYEIVSTIMDFQWTQSVVNFVLMEDIGAYFGSVYFVTNSVAVFVQLFLTSLVMRRFGVGTALLFLPVAALSSSVGFLIFPILMIGNALSVSDNGLNYSINQSAKESLYVPTTPEIKYRAKAFIDMFVQRFAKSFAVAINLIVTTVMGIGGIRWLSFVSIALLTVWIIAVRFAGRQFDIMTKQSESNAIEGSE